MADRCEDDSCAGETARSLFCATCGKVLDPVGLKRVRIQGFTGAASTNPKIERFWETGDPAGV